jgi:hypothetical protein
LDEIAVAVILGSISPDSVVVAIAADDDDDDVFAARTRVCLVLADVVDTAVVVELVVDWVFESISIAVLPTVDTDAILQIS